MHVCPLPYTAFSTHDMEKKKMNNEQRKPCFPGSHISLTTAPCQLCQSPSLVPLSMVVIVTLVLYRITIRGIAQADDQPSLPPLSHAVLC